MDQMFTELNDNLSDNSLIKLTQNLELITNELKTEGNRIALSENSNNWIIVSKLLTRISVQISQRNDCLLTNETLLPLITQLFRFMRNSLIDCLENKRSIVTIEDIFENTINVFNHLIVCYKNVNLFNENNCLVSKPNLIQTIKTCLQVFANLLSGLDQTNEDLYSIRDKIWKLFAFDLFRDLLRFESDKSIVLISSMIFYSTIRNNSNIELNLIETTKSDDLFKLFNIFEILLNQIETESSEWSLWSIELMFKIKNFLNCFYSKFQNREKLILLDIIYELIVSNNSKTESNTALNNSNLVYLCQTFKQSIGEIVKIDSQTDDSNELNQNKYISIQISKLLSILCELTTNKHYLNVLQNDRLLMECLINTLKTIQLIGKTDVSSHFKPMSRLRQINESESEAQNPVFGFKRAIIRVIANLSYDCSQMQDWIREMDGIPLVLDCCNIDAKNPYIMEWSVFALRNIVKNNALNQEIISQLSRNGVLIDDHLTEKLGLKHGFNK